MILLIQIYNIHIIFYNTTYKAPMSFYFSGWIIFSGCPDGLRMVGSSCAFVDE